MNHALPLDDRPCTALPDDMASLLPEMEAIKLAIARAKAHTQTILTAETRAVWQAPEPALMPGEHGPAEVTPRIAAVQRPEPSIDVSHSSSVPPLYDEVTSEDIEQSKYAQLLIETSDVCVQACYRSKRRAAEEVQAHITHDEVLSAEIELKLIEAQDATRTTDSMEGDAIAMDASASSLPERANRVPTPRVRRGANCMESAALGFSLSVAALWLVFYIPNAAAPQVDVHALASIKRQLLEVKPTLRITLPAQPLYLRLDTKLVTADTALAAAEPALESAPVATAD